MTFTQVAHRHKQYEGGHYLRMDPSAALISSRRLLNAISRFLYMHGGRKWILNCYDRSKGGMFDEGDAAARQQQPQLPSSVLSLSSPLISDDPLASI